MSIVITARSEFRLLEVKHRSGSMKPHPPIFVYVPCFVAKEGDMMLHQLHVVCSDDIPKARIVDTSNKDDSMD